MTRIIRAGVAGASALALALLSPVATASAQEGQTIITNTETVNVSLDPSGNVDVARVYDQIAIQGSGEVAYTNPVSTEGLRNLDAFGGFTVEEGSVVEDTSVDGQLRRRALSDFDQDLPITISATYSLDGQPIDPADLVGKSGTVEAVFRVENMTGAEEEISYPDGTGGTVTETAMVYDPYAGSLGFTLPPNFTDVTSDDGFVTAGDGRGGTLMNYGITLISGLTEPVAEVSYTATVSNAVIPPVTLSVLPVVVEAAPSAVAQLEALQGGVESGQELASNGELLDENVLALASGAAELVNGIIQLDEGAQQLSAGLVNVAAPGSAELAAGADQLSDGLNELQSNVPALNSGVSQLDSGAQTLASGVASLDAGLAKLYAGVDKLPEDVKASLAGNPDYQKLLGGLDQIIAGLRYPGPTDCDVGLAGGDPQACGAMDAVEFVADLLGDAAAAGGDIDLLIGAAKGAYAQSKSPLLPDPPFAACPTDADLGVTVPVPPVIPPTSLTGSLGLPQTDICVLISNVTYGLALPKQVLSPTDSGGLKAQTQSAADALVDVYTGVDGELIPGLGQVKAGIPALVDVILANIEATLLASIGTPTPGCNPTATLRCASAALSAGAAELAAGTGELNASVGPLASGVNQLADGGEQVADGANQLADGLGDAADGSVQLSSGLGDAAEAAPALPQGAQRLSAEGTSQLVAAGDDTTQSFGARVALIQAASDRTADGGLPYGGPEDAIVAAAYRYDLSEATGATAQNTGQLLAGLVIAGAAVAGATVLARRKTA